jgi:uncharacterized protein YndB with AHSA1/START domain
MPEPEPSQNSVALPTSIDEAFELICDPTRYPTWLVGAKAIRRVDPTWPKAGSKFEHRIGAGPLVLAGSTTVREIRPPVLLVLAAGMGPLGEALVRFELEPAGAETHVRMVEAPRKGPAGVAARVLGPLVRWTVWGRNAVSLEHLRHLVQQLPADAAAAAPDDVVDPDASPG